MSEINEMNTIVKWTHLTFCSKKNGEHNGKAGGKSALEKSYTAGRCPSHPWTRLSSTNALHFRKTALAYWRERTSSRPAGGARNPPSRRIETTFPSIPRAADHFRKPRPTWRRPSSTILVKSSGLRQRKKKRKLLKTWWECVMAVSFLNCWR